MTHFNNDGMKNTITERASDWLKHRQNEHPWLILTGAASIGLSLASFYTTFVGWLAFAPNWVIGFLITFGAQSLLFASSWFIGFAVMAKDPSRYPEDVRSNRQKFAIVSAVFVATFSFSVFFSTSALFDTIFDTSLQELSQRTRVISGVSSALVKLEKELEGERRGAIEDLIKADAYRTWRGNVEKVAEVAIRHKNHIADAVKKAREDAIEAVSAEQASLSRKGGQLEALKVAAQRLKLAIPQATADLAAAQKYISETQAAVREQELILNAAKERVDREERAGDTKTGRPSGKGPVFRQLEQERLDAKVSYDHAVSRAKAATEAREAAEKKFADVTAESSRVATEISAIESRLTAAENGGATVVDVAALTEINLSDIRGSLNTELDLFEKTFQTANFDKAAILCNSLMEQISQVKNATTITGELTCDRGGMGGLVHPVEATAKALQAFRSQCRTGEQAASIPKMTFGERLAFGNDCIRLSGLTSDALNAIQDELSRLEREEDPRASPFVKILNALNSGEKLAWVAVFLALLIDSLVLGCGFLGALGERKSASTRSDDFGATTLDSMLDLEIRPEDDNKIRCLKIMLASLSSASYVKRGVVYHFLIDLNSIPDQNIAVIARHVLLAMKVGGRQVLISEDDPEKFLLNQNGYDTLVGDLRRATANASTQSPSEQQTTTPFQPQMARRPGGHNPPSGSLSGAKATPIQF